jgi:mutator protein MutT
MLTKKKLKVACAIIICDYKVLIAKRKTGEFHAGYWEFPGGKIKFREKPQDAVKREIFEELNVNVCPLEKITPVRHEYDSHIVELIPLLCTLQSSNFVPVVHDELKWIDEKFDMNINILPPDRIIWEETKTILKKYPR